MTIEEELNLDRLLCNGAPLIRLCIDITLYWTGSIFDQREGILKAYFRSMEVVRNDLNFYRTETMRSYREINSGTLDLLPFWLTNAAAMRDLYILHLISSDSLEGPAKTAFVFRAIERQKRGALRLVLPVEYIESSPTLLLELTQELAANIGFMSGHAGYSFCLAEDVGLEFRARRELLRLGMRFPGIDIPSVNTTLFIVSDGIKCVNWLTLVGFELLARLGAMVEIPTPLDGVVNVERLHHGVIFKAGAAPRCGDSHRHDILSSYRRVGRMLLPIRALNHPPFVVRGKLPDEDATEAWLGRFDQ